jgi:hypothetical protein
MASYYMIFLMIFQCIIIFVILNNYLSINEIKSYVHKLVQKKIILESNILNWINNDKVNTYVNPDVTIKYSKKSKNRSIFANKDYKINDILEICPTIKHPKNYGGPLEKYVFDYDYYNNLIAFGYCSIYNTNKDAPNIIYNIINENQIEIKVIQNIKKGDEIFLA